MELLSLAAFLAASAIVSMSLRPVSPVFARQTAFAAGALALLKVIAVLSGALDEIRRIAELGGIAPAAVSTVFKAVGIAYLTRAAASVCRDAGETALGETAETAGRVLLMLIALPIVRSIAEAVIRLVNSTL